MPQPLPVYTSSESVQVSPILDPDSGWRALGNIAGHISTEFAQDAAKQREAVLAMDRAISGNQLSAQREQLNTDAQLKFKDQVHAAQYAQQNFQAFTNKFVQNALPENRPYLTALAGRLLLDNQKDYDKKIVAQQQVTNQVNLYNNLDSAQNDIENNLRNGNLDSAQEAYGRKLNLAEDALNMGLLKVPEYEQLKKTTQKDYYQSQTLYKVGQLAQQHDEEGLKKLYSDLMDKDIPNFNAEEKKNLISQGNALYNNFQQANKVNAALALDQSKNILANTLQGLPVDTNEINLTRQNLSAEQRALFDKHLAENKDSFNRVNYAQSLDPAKRQEYLTSLPEEIGAKRAEVVQKLLNNFQAQFKQDPHAASAKAIAVQQNTQTNNQVDLAAIQTDSNPNKRQFTLGNNIDNNVAYQTKVMHTPPENVWVMDKAVAQEYANRLASITPKEISKLPELFGELKDKYGKWYPQAVRNITSIKDSGIGKNIPYVADLDQNNPNTSKIWEANLTPIPQLEKGIDPKKIKSLKDGINTLMGGGTHNWIYNTGFNTVKDYVNQIRTIGGIKNGDESLAGLNKYLYKTSLGFIQSGSASEWDDALQMASDTVTNKFNYPKINGIQTMIPVNYKGKPLLADDVEAYANQKLQALKDVYVKVPGHLFENRGFLDVPFVRKFLLEKGYSKEPEQLAVEALTGEEKQIPILNRPQDPETQRMLYFQNHIQGGHWRSNGTFSGLQYIDSTNNPVIDNKTGQPYGFTYDEMRTGQVNTEAPVAEEEGWSDKLRDKLRANFKRNLNKEIKSIRHEMGLDKDE